MKKSKAKLAIIISVSVVLIGLLTFGYATFAYIHLHSFYSYDYTNYSSTKYIAHRGYSGKYYDNTEESILAASENVFFDGIETDIRLTKDKVWVCVHDDNPFIDKDILVSNSNYEDIKDLPLDISNAHVDADVNRTYTLCTYERYLQILKNCNKIALIEIKGKYTQEELTPAVNMAYETLQPTKIFFAGFDINNLQHVKKINSRTKLLAFGNDLYEAYFYTKMGFNLGVNYQNAKESVIKRAHESNHLIFTYTVDSPNLASQLKKNHVDFVITNVCLTEKAN
ncbi:MAG: hypothetical protein J6A99_03120 [Clostridia bacterium]|nr:hypothetical protein [Clostridia bacterium]